jgi:uncharacterized membrane protein YozB (DUF420 family)
MMLIVAVIAAGALYRRGGDINQLAAAFVVVSLAFGLLVDGLRWLVQRRRQAGRATPPDWVWTRVAFPAALIVALVAAGALYRRGGNINQLAAAFVVLALAYGVLAGGLRWLGRRHRQVDRATPP